MNDIVLNQGDSRTIPNIHLKIGSEATAVTVISGTDAEIPVDNAEISATLNNELVDSATLTGRNAAELIKMMPGVTFNNSGNAARVSTVRSRAPTTARRAVSHPTAHSLTVRRLSFLMVPT